MADAKKKSEPAPAEASSAPAKKLAMSTAVVFMLAGGPAPVKAEGDAAVVMNQDNERVEVQVAAEKYQNARQGKVFLYDTEVFVGVARKHEAKVAAEIKRASARIRSEVQAIFGRADPAHLLAADRATLSRQVRAVLDEIVGKDEEGKPLILDVMIPKCIQYGF